MSQSMFRRKHIFIPLCKGSSRYETFFPLFWWLTFVFVVAFVLMSLDYTFVNAFWVAVVLLPSMLCVHYFVPQLSFCNMREGIFHSICLVSAVLAMEILSIVNANFYLVGLDCGQMPPVLMNPFFLLLILCAAVVPEMAIEKFFAMKYPLDETISFISDRRKITLQTSDVLCIESNDFEVWIRTASGEAYRTKTRILQWEGMLYRRFLRVHRSFIVNTEFVTEYNPNRLVSGGRTIDISRKYKDAVRRYFAATKPAPTVTDIP